MGGPAAPMRVMWLPRFCRHRSKECYREARASPGQGGECALALGRLPSALDLALPIQRNLRLCSGKVKNKT